MIATSQRLASEAGLAAIRRGGNAVDAVLTAAIALPLLEPTGNGLGSDSFAIVSCDGELHGLNACGRSPAAFTAERFTGRAKIPPWGWDAVTVPGAVSGWVELSRRFGRLEFAELFKPAIRFAREGFEVQEITAAAWARSVEVFKEFEGFRRIFAPDGRAPGAGEIFRSEAMARAYELIAESAGEAFYTGEIAQEIASCAARDGGLLTLADLAAHRAEWVEPLRIDYRGVTLHELPPPGQGIAALIAAGILREFDLPSMAPRSVRALHLQIESMKLAFKETYRHVADPAHMSVAFQELIDETRLKELAALIDPEHAQDFNHGGGDRGGTVCLSAADDEGMMVSFIQSNYRGFGSGVVIERYGVSLQNRGCGFTLAEGHPNRAAGAKLPFHTIIPGFVTKAGEPLMVFGLMGGPMQPQGHLQVLSSMFDWGLTPQQASDLPRWQVTEGLELLVEREFDADALSALESMGHAPRRTGMGAFGGAQIILREDDGSYVGGSDHRKDGSAAC